MIISIVVAGWAARGEDILSRLMETDEGACRLVYGTKKFFLSITIDKKISVCLNNLLFRGKGKVMHNVENSCKRFTLTSGGVIRENRNNRKLVGKNEEKCQCIQREKEYNIIP